MRVFVTGASGHIGSAVVPELLEAGHDVAGLARSEESAAKVAASGASVVHGGLDDLDVLREAAAQRTASSTSPSATTSCRPARWNAQRRWTWPRSGRCTSR